MRALNDQEKLAYLSGRWGSPKEIGALAEGRFDVERLRPFSLQDRAIGGCWLVSPPDGDYWTKRRAFFLGNPTHGCVPVKITEAALYLRSLGVQSYLATPDGPREAPQWEFRDVLGAGTPELLPQILAGYPTRQRAYRPRNTGANTAILTALPSDVIDDIYLKQRLFDDLNVTHRMAAVDLDYFYFGRERIVPIEIKEKICAEPGTPNAYFGLDIGPFIKLCLFLQSGEPLFVVREIFDAQQRTNAQWKYIHFKEALTASNWVAIEGGTSMTGGRSVTVRIPYTRFDDLNSSAMHEL